MIDLTGANLVAYLLRVIRDIVERNPRFKNTLGSVTFPANTIIAWKDVWVSIRNVTTSGTRLSPNYFMCTQQGRAILAKVSDKPGQLVEWVREVDKTRQTPEAGVYYVNVDFFDEQSNDIGLTCQQFKWLEGKVVEAEGSQVFFRAGIIDPVTSQPVDLNTLIAVDQNNATVQYEAFNQLYGGFMNLLTPVVTLTLKFSNGTPLVPNVDYWFQRSMTYTICDKTLGGTELISLPRNPDPPAWDDTTAYTIGQTVLYQGYKYVCVVANTNKPPLDYPNQSDPTTYWTSYNVASSQPYVSYKIYDQDGYVLRPNTDYATYGNGFIQLATWSPAGSTLYCDAVVKLDPTVVSATNPENIIPINLGPNEVLAPGQVFIHTTNGDYPNQTAVNGEITLPQLLAPGQWCRWEVRIEEPQVRCSAKKWELNSLVIVDPATIQYKQPPTPQGSQPLPPVQISAGEPLLDANGKQQYFLPGLHLAVGDQVIVGDQVAVIVSPTLTETYEVFGSKENIGFTLEVKANDLQTASDLAEMLKQQLLILGRENAEADGLTVFEATRDFQGVQRDASATAPSYVYTVSVSASADWKVFVPLVTRMVQYEITDTIANPDFQGKLQMANRMQALGATQFIPSYK